MLRYMYLLVSLGPVISLPRQISQLLQTLSPTVPALMVLLMGTHRCSALVSASSAVQQSALRLLSNQHRCRTRATNPFETVCQPQHLQRVTLPRDAVSAEDRALKQANSQSVLMPTSYHRLRMLPRCPDRLPALGQLLAMSADTAQRHHLARTV